MVRVPGCTPLYVLFADDNANSGTDEGCQYDNFSLRVTAGSPPVALAASLTPPNGSTMPFGASLSLTAFLAGGAAPYAAEFYVNGQLAGSLSSPPFTLNLGLLQVGSYTCYVHATDSSVPAQQASSTTNRITILPPPLRVMPLGDSITLGLYVAGGYRAPLYQLLTNAGYNVDFIGTQAGNGAAGLPDSDHEGYSGFTITAIDTNLSSVFNAVVEPDIILPLVGLNDYRSGQAAQATNRIEALIVRLATKINLSPQSALALADARANR
jgi:hypothetical protein